MFYILILPLIICFVCSIWTIISNKEVGDEEQNRKSDEQYRADEEDEAVLRDADCATLADELHEWIG